MMNSTVLAAESFAKDAHRDQKYGVHPYHVHLADVAREMEIVLGMPAFAFYDREVALCGAWLHDVLEDTEVTAPKLSAYFGPRVADLVLSVTDEAGKNRRERKERTYPKTRAAGPLAVALKLSDRLANVANALLSRSPLLGMYGKEQPEFKTALYRPDDGLDSVWRRLDGLLGT